MKEKKNELDILFPVTEVSLGEGITVNVRPVNAEDLPKVIRQFGDIFRKAVKDGASPATLATEALAERLQLLPFCIDRPVKEIPVHAVPDVLKAVIEVNVTPESVKKWQELAQMLTQKVGDTSQQA